MKIKIELLRSVQVVADFKDQQPFIDWRPLPVYQSILADKTRPRREKKNLVSFDLSRP